MFKIAEISKVAMGWEIKIGDGVTADLSLFCNEVKLDKGLKITTGEHTDSLQEINP